MCKSATYVYLLLFFCNFSICCYSQQKIISHTDKHIRYEGRVAIKSDATELIWSGTSITIQFNGTGVSGIFKDADTANYYNIIIDKTNISKIHFDTIKKSYELASGLAEGKHQLTLFKRTEWDKGKTFFYGFELKDQTKLTKPAKLPKRKIEFFGNSVTCGYAIEDNVHDSHFGYFENNYDAYAAITARHFNSQYHCTSKSGIGILLSWFPLIMPEMYNRLDPTDSSSRWDFSNYRPDIVVINLFQNDSWLVNMPTHEQFKNRFGNTKPSETTIILAYKNFVQTIRKQYPKASIICMLGNMDITRKGSPWPGYVQAAITQLNDKKIYSYFAPFKETGGHPKTAEQKLLADGLIKFIEENINW